MGFRRGSPTRCYQLAGLPIVTSWFLGSVVACFAPTVWLALRLAIDLYRKEHVGGNDTAYRLLSAATAFTEASGRSISADARSLLDGPVEREGRDAKVPQQLGEEEGFRSPAGCNAATDYTSTRHADDDPRSDHVDHSVSPSSRRTAWGLYSFARQDARTPVAVLDHLDDRLAERRARRLVARLRPAGQHALDRAGIELLGVPDLAGLVDLLPGQTEIGSGRDNLVPFWNEVRPRSGPPDLLVRLRGVKFIREPHLRAGLDQERAT